MAHRDSIHAFKLKVSVRFCVDINHHRVGHITINTPLLLITYINLLVWQAALSIASLQDDLDNLSAFFSGNGG